MKFHPQKNALIKELHNRNFPVVSLPAQVSSLVLFNPGDRQSEVDRLTDFATMYDVAPPQVGESCYYQSFKEFDFRWERHNEFSTYTVICQRQSETELCRNLFSLIDADWLDRLSGEVIAANHIDLRPTSMASQELQDYFDGKRLVGSKIYDGLATVWTSVQHDDDGFIRTLVVDEGIDALQAGRAIRNLLEIAAYRAMTLLALPIARELIPAVTKLEGQLVGTNAKLNLLKTVEDEQNLMTELIAEATQLEKLVADHNFRFSATQAYFSLTESRLDMLREQKLPTFRTLKQFHVRRFIPAFHTCMSVVKRKEDLSKRISRTTELLNSRLQLSLELQNQRLLASMDKRSALQLRLQQTVEGLSVVAMTYYSMSLIKLVIEPLPVEQYLSMSKTMALAFMTPFVFAGALMLVKRIRNKLEK
ncbi:DUF3422 domain-containing protein [SAR92 clade bacterium H455]|uniref:DUF3422 domain-containing protein n=1 Tax=SAR92 clade bacterium H455 TaxID=2974818 RepID=A0ABY5TIX1_9GAMM|nr:DUF3422 domain-containing protein [SAR92 clade bacterium H455]